MERTDRTRRQGEKPSWRASGAVVVTGASTGIGRACALKLADSGFWGFAGVCKEEDAEALMEASTGRLTPLFIDVTDVDLVSAPASVAEEVVGKDGLAGLVMSIGAGLCHGPGLELRTHC